MPYAAMVWFMRHTPHGVLTGQVQVAQAIRQSLYLGGEHQALDVVLLRDGAVVFALRGRFAHDFAFAQVAAGVLSGLGVVGAQQQLAGETREQGLRAVTTVGFAQLRDRLQAHDGAQAVLAAFGERIAQALHASQARHFIEQQPVAARRIGRQRERGVHGFAEPGGQQGSQGGGLVFAIR